MLLDKMYWAVPQTDGLILYSLCCVLILSLRCARNRCYHRDFTGFTRNRQAETLRSLHKTLPCTIFQEGIITVYMLHIKPWPRTLNDSQEHLMCSWYCIYIGAARISTWISYKHKTSCLLHACINHEANYIQAFGMAIISGWGIQDNHCTANSVSRVPPDVHVWGCSNWVSREEITHVRQHNLACISFS